MSADAVEQELDYVEEPESEPVSAPEPAPVAPPVVDRDTPPGSDPNKVVVRERDEVDRLDPQPTPMVLVSGTEFDLEPLKLRQFLRLLRIITRGAAGMLDSTELDFEDPQAFAQTLLGMMLFSLPEAEEETIDFLKSMVKPRNMTGNPERDLIKVQDLLDEFDNPDLEDVITVAQCIVEVEAEDLRALGKRLGAMLQTAQKVGLAPKTK